jgi:pimeloyl-ACP methyl ester carboxylesterase
MRGRMRTWYDEHGEREAAPLVLLHPGGADARAFAPNIDALAARFHVFTPGRRGHGHTPDVEGPISYELMADDTIAFLEAVVGGPAPLVGCSDGATVALLVALRRPDLKDVSSRTLVMVGDDDEVSLEHAIALYRGVPDAELAVVPGSSHGLLVEKPALCNTIVVGFLTTDPAPTLAPIRRASRVHEGS